MTHPDTQGPVPFTCSKCGELIPLGTQYWSVVVAREVQVLHSIDVLWGTPVLVYCVPCSKTVNLFDLQVPPGTTKQVCPAQDGVPVPVFSEGASSTRFDVDGHEHPPKDEPFNCPKCDSDNLDGYRCMDCDYVIEGPEDDDIPY